MEATIYYLGMFQIDDTSADKRLSYGLYRNTVGYGTKINMRRKNLPGYVYLYSSNDCSGDHFDIYSKEIGKYMDLNGHSLESIWVNPSTFLYVSDSREYYNYFYRWTDRE